jgi:hypothetical protein
MEVYREVLDMAPRTPYELGHWLVESMACLGSNPPNRRLLLTHPSPIVMDAIPEPRSALDDGTAAVAVFAPQEIAR